jgi:rhamnopyranosyl-N-acetylglucosaminyl-diphospho-decaprenol beta-1,3/1,4-galactofuranosyltransferase
VATPRVVASILTRNRRDLLRDALAAVMAQTRPVDDVIVVDNESTDGTPEMLRDEFPGVRVVALPENQGATGGFSEAIKAGYDHGADWIWLLDDDSIAGPTALAELLTVSEGPDGSGSPDLLCSRVEWRHGEPHPMNRPVLRRRDPEVLVDSVSRGLLPVRAATWVSLLLSRASIERAGLPPRHFFYQADDIEYTARILLEGQGYYVPGSVVEHRTPTQHTAVDDDHRFYYHARNTVLMLRGGAWRPSEKPTLAWFLFWTSLVYLRRNRLSPSSIRNVVSGVLAGLFFRLPAEPDRVGGRQGA